MSVFKRVTDEYEKETAAAHAKAAKQKAAEESARAAFELDAKKVFADSATPIFQRFLEDARAAGYPAQIDQEQHGSAPSISLRTSAQKRPTLGPANEEAVLSLRADLSKQVIIVTEYPNQRQGRSGSSKATEYTLSAVTVEVIETHLASMWSKALRAD